jgi:SAM-dependent methyltransferase
VLGSSPQRVLDLGAGTGAFTSVLIDLGHQVVAAEPSMAMLHELRAPAVHHHRVQARGEALPFGDGRFDTVTMAGAFHWMDPRLAVPELARVLRQGGTVGILYNTREDSTPWAADLTALVTTTQPPSLAGHWGSGSVSAFDGTDLFTPRDYREFRWAQPMDRTQWVGLVASRSYVINLDDVRRSEVLQATGALFDHHADGAPTLDLPYRTQVWTAQTL